MAQVSRGRNVGLSGVSPRSWALVVVGLVVIVLGVGLAWNLDDTKIATWANFPWLSGILLLNGLVACLGAVNVDAERYSGPGGGKRFARHSILTLALTVGAAGAPVGMAVVLGRSLAEAVQYAVGGLIAMQGICLLTARFRTAS